jgi:hypothetical protein
MKTNRNANSNGDQPAISPTPRAWAHHRQCCLAAVYLFDISRAADAASLLACRSDALADDCLDHEEKVGICHAIEQRCVFLNLRTKNFAPSKLITALSVKIL